MADLLLELFSEEIPARMQMQAATDLVLGLRSSLEKQGLPLEIGAFEPYVTPRRLAVWVKDLLAIQPDTEIERKGPKTNAPAAAIDGFLRSTGLSLEQLEKRVVGKDETYFAVIQQKGRATAEVLKEVIEEVLKNFPWPKSMRWGNHEMRWVRPLHSILCIFDGKIVPVQFGYLTASNTTRGHRFLAPEAITLTEPAIYEESLQKAYVLADCDKRKEFIREQVASLADKHGLKVVADAGLLDEVTGLVEWPVPLLGKIDAEYMELPREVIISVMRGHQKYFAAEDSDGKLAPYFITVANRFTADEGKAIIAGNERVLRARLADGKFFWDQDRFYLEGPKKGQRRTLDDWAKGLSSVTYHAKLGSLAGKVRDIEHSAVTLCHILKYDALKDKIFRAAELCKADLVTGIVGEFAELQGIMGRYYALEQGEDPAVADAIRDQYAHAIDDLPTQLVSICISLAEKFDTLIAMFSMGEKPSGSKDPFALRRAALSVIGITEKNTLRYSLSYLLSVLGETRLTADKQKELENFFLDRLIVRLKQQNIEADRIRAVFSQGESDFVRGSARVRALHNFLQTEDGINLLAAYKRASNILKIEEKKDAVTYAAVELNLSSLKEPEEITLASKLTETQNTLKPLLENENFEEAMHVLSNLRTPVDLFFDKILVNAEDKDLRANRLRLLASIRDLMNKIADFSQIAG